MKPGSSSVALARLKRAIDRLVVHPISNLIATDQVRGGDWIRSDHTSGSPAMSFHREWGTSARLRDGQVG
jgi:hypothetical protein